MTDMPRSTPSRPRPLFWFSAPVKAHMVPVFFTCPEISPVMSRPLAEALTFGIEPKGRTCKELRRYALENLGVDGEWPVQEKSLWVLINAGTLAARVTQAERDAHYQELVCHEMLGHGSVWFVGYSKGWRSDRHTQILPARVEERFVSEQSPVVRDTLNALGFIWPKYPRGLRALERWARDQR